MNEGEDLSIDYSDCKDRGFKAIIKRIRDFVAEQLWKFLQLGVLITATNFAMLLAVFIKTYDIQKYIPLPTWLMVTLALLAAMVFADIWVDKMKMVVKMTVAQRKRSEPFTRILENQEKIMEHMGIRCDK